MTGEDEPSSVGCAVIVMIAGAVLLLAVVVGVSLT